MQETCVPSLGREDALEKGTATHSSILAWRIPWAEEPGGLQSMGSQRVRHNRSDVAQHSTRGPVETVGRVICHSWEWISRSQFEC